MGQVRRATRCNACAEASLNLRGARKVRFQEIGISDGLSGQARLDAQTFNSVREISHLHQTHKRTRNSTAITQRFNSCSPSHWNKIQESHGLDGRCHAPGDVVAQGRVLHPFQIRPPNHHRGGTRMGGTKPTRMAAAVRCFQRMKRKIGMTPMSVANLTG